MSNEQCRLFETCEAPLCPLDKTSIEHAVWYPDEEICRARKFQSLPWIQKQKRIAKLGLTWEDGFFTVKMLKTIQVVTKSLKGADPDDFGSEEKWLKQRLSAGAKSDRGSQKRGRLQIERKEKGLRF